MGANSLLIRWVGGWHVVSDVTTNLKREALLGLGAAQSIPEVERIAADQLAVYRECRAQISAGVEPSLDADTPYVGFNVGDHVAVPDETGAAVSERVMSVTVSMDEHGKLTYAPELRDLIAQRVERWEQALKKYSNGTMRGDSKAATPVANIAKRYVAYTSGPVPT